MKSSAIRCQLYKCHLEKRLYNLSLLFSQDKSRKILGCPIRLDECGLFVPILITGYLVGTAGTTPNAGDLDEEDYYKSRNNKR